MRVPRAVPVVLSTLVAVGLSCAPAHAAGHNPGVVGKRITLTTHKQFNSYDVAADNTGTAYIGWIVLDSSSPDGLSIHFCVLPVGRNACQGGVQTIDQVAGASSAADLHVLSTPSGHVTLEWFYNSSATTGAVAAVTALRGQHPSQPVKVASAAYNGDLLDAEFAPNGSTIWTVTDAPLPSKKLLVTPGAIKPSKSVAMPWSASSAQLAFTGGRPVLTIDKDAAISVATKYATGTSSGTFGKFKNVGRTWTSHQGVLKNTPHGLRYIGKHDDADYRAVIAKWTGHGFSRPQFTADHNACVPSTHDGSRDSSGRLLDVSNECSAIAVADYADDTHAAIYRFKGGSGSSTIVTMAPQIASGVRGIATVLWSTQTDGVTGDALHAVRVALPDTTRTVHKHGRAGRVNLIGPTSCLPPVLVHVKVGANPARGWKVASRTLKLGARTVHGRRIDGATLAPGKRYTLNGRVAFKKGSHHSTIMAALTFTTCAKG